VFVFIHGGNWQRGMAKDYGFPAEMFVAAGAHYRTARGQLNIAIVNIWAINAMVIGHTMMSSSRSPMVTPSRYKR
jgi:hypothetical protein